MTFSMAAKYLLICNNDTNLILVILSFINDNVRPILSLVGYLGVGGEMQTPDIRRYRI